MIKRFVDIHATVFVESGKSAVVPQYVTNHGILSGPDLHQLLQESKVACQTLVTDARTGFPLIWKVGELIWSGKNWGILLMVRGKIVCVVRVA